MAVLSTVFFCLVLVFRKFQIQFTAQAFARTSTSKWIFNSFSLSIDDRGPKSIETQQSFGTVTIKRSYDKQGTKTKTQLINPRVEVTRSTGPNKAKMKTSKHNTKIVILFSHLQIVLNRRSRKKHFSFFSPVCFCHLCSFGVHKSVRNLSFFRFFFLLFDSSCLLSTSLLLFSVSLHTLSPSLFRFDLLVFFLHSFRSLSPLVVSYMYLILLFFFCCFVSMIYTHTHTNANMIDLLVPFASSFFFFFLYSHFAHFVKNAIQYTWLCSNSQNIGV